MAYVHKRSVLDCFSPRVLQDVQRTEKWGNDKTTTAIMAHFHSGASLVDFDIEIEGDDVTVMEPDYVFVEGHRWGEVVGVRSTKYLTIRAPVETASSIIQGLFYPPSSLK